MERTPEAAAPSQPERAATGAGDRTTVLIVEPDAAGAGLLRNALAAVRDARVEWVTRLDETVERLGQGSVDVVVVGQGLADGDTAEACARMREAAPDALVLPPGEPGSGGPQAAPAVTDDPAAGRRAEPPWLPEVVHYVTRRKQAEAVLHAADEALFEEKERAQVTLSSIGDAVLVTNLDGDVTYLNPVAETLTGRTRADAIGRPLSEVFDIVDGTTREPAIAPTVRAMQEDRTLGLQANCVLRRRDGGESGIEDSAAPIHDRHGRVSGAVIVFRDVTQSRAMARKLTYLAQHDPLTGLSNRALLNERLSQSIRLARRHEKQVALLFVDLDDFKEINDSLGHLVGDHVLQAVAERLTASVRTADTVCRQGGDEFVVLVSEIGEPDDAIRVADKLLAAFAAPLVVDGHTLLVAISIGISVFPDDGDTAESIIQHADAAMYHAKGNGNDHGSLSQTAGNNGSTARSNAEINLHRAFKKGEFLLHYQPQIDLATGSVNGAEALIRWRDPDHGMVPPDEFVPLAERCGLIVPIGHWVLQEACRQASRWQASGLPALPIAVNISAAEFRREHFTEGVAEILRETALEPGSVELEVTESVLMQDIDSSLVTLNALKELGVRIAIDDFGTGYSSLSYLRRFPIDTLKIDKSFMADVGADPDSTTVLRAIISLGRSLGHRVVAEGVENLHQLAFVHVQRCDGAQGLEIGDPVTAGEFSRLLADMGAQPDAPRRARAETA